MLAIQQLRLGWGVHGILIKRHRGRSRQIHWEELDLKNQQQLEERAAELLREEIATQEERVKTQVKIDHEVRLNKIKSLQKKIEEIKQNESVLARQKEFLLKQLYQFQEEDDIEALMLLI